MIANKWRSVNVLTSACTYTDEDEEEDEDLLFEEDGNKGILLPLLELIHSIPVVIYLQSEWQYNDYCLEITEDSLGEICEFWTTSQNP